jgi:excisionase family DNA binding protein
METSSKHIDIRQRLPTQSDSRESQNYGTMRSGPGSFLENSSNTSHPPIDLLTISEAAALLKISVTGMRRLQQRRCISFIKIGGSVRFGVPDITAYLRKRRVEAINK